jgi:hypothetical protein
MKGGEMMEAIKILNPKALDVDIANEEVYLCDCDCDSWGDTLG